MRMQVDISQGAMVVPVVDCASCRIGGHMYDVSKSPSSGRSGKGKAILCSDERCAPPTVRNESTSSCDRSMCSSCAPNGGCCRPRKGRDEALCRYDLVYTSRTRAEGALYQDSLDIGKLHVRELLFGGVDNVSRTFEQPYVDGVLGLGYTPSRTCVSSCVPAAMDSIVKETGLADTFSMCVSEFGGTLVLGDAPTELAAEPFRYVPTSWGEDTEHFIVRAEGYATIGEERVELPEIASAVWSSVTTSIVVGKVSFMAILEQLMMSHCDIPGLCSTHSWFRPQSCHALPDEDLAKLPPITFHLTDGPDITLEGEDYMLPYKLANGKQYRCVGFLAVDLLSTHGVGMMLGTAVMRKHAVSFDRKKHRVGIAKAKRDKCGPRTGDFHGLVETVGGVVKNVTQDEVLTVDTPYFHSNDEGRIDNSSAVQSESCRALAACGACARAANCTYRYTDGACLASSRTSTSVYPYCQGGLCMCFLMGMSGWYVGIAAGALTSLLMVLCCLHMYTRRKRKLRYQAVVPFAENEVETF